MGKPLTSLPEGFSPHKKVGEISPISPPYLPCISPTSPVHLAVQVGEIYRARQKMIETGEGIDWALGET